MQNFGVILGLVALYFFVILGFVVYARFKESKTILPGLNEFFLAGKNLHPLVLVFTFTASIFSTFSVMGMPALSYVHGLGATLFYLAWLIPAVPFTVFIGKRLRAFAQDKRIFSPIEIFSQSYKSRRLGLFIAIVYALFLMPYISLQLVGIGAFVEAYTQGAITYVTGVGAMMLIVVVYLFLGGMRAVAYTDFVQIMAMFIGLCVGALYLLQYHDLTVVQLAKDTLQNTPKHLAPAGAKEHFSPEMILTSGVVLAGVIAQPHLMTRNLMAKNDREINYMAIGCVIGTILVAAFGLFYGLFAFQKYGADLKPNLLMGHVFQDMASWGGVGLVLSTFMLMGALGAAMSTADSLLISIGQISTRDVVRPFVKMTPKRQVVVSKAIMSAVLVAAYVIGLKPPQFMTDLAMYSAAGCAVIVPTIIAFEWKYRSTIGAYLSIVVGLVCLAASVLYKAQTGVSFAGIHPGAAPLFVSLVTYGLCSAYIYAAKADQSRPQMIVR